MAGQGQHRAPQVKDVYKCEVGFTLAPYKIVLRRMNADGKSYALARLKAEVVG